MGVSRSVACAIAYLMKENTTRFKETLELVKSCRKIANPNDGFVKQLIEYEGYINYNK